MELLIDEVLRNRSVPLTRSEDGISEPAALRRADGSSVYTVAGSELFTSARILAAEHDWSRPLANRTDGLWRPPLWIWRCSNPPRIGTP